VDYYHRVINRFIPQAEFHQNRYARAVTPMLVWGRRWLDLGAGRRIHGGWNCPPERELAAAASAFVGCDLDIDGMKANPHLHHRIASDAQSLPFPADSFDLVTANMVLEHLVNPAAVFAEIARVLRPEGRFVFVTPNRAHPVVRLMGTLLSVRQRRLVAHVLENRPMFNVFPTYYRANTADDLRRLAAEVRLEPVELEVFCSWPMFRGPRPLTFLEAQFIRATLEYRRIRNLGSNIFGAFARPA
jgi:SAM-dependent methyltransferase